MAHKGRRRAPGKLAFSGEASLCESMAKPGFFVRYRCCCRLIAFAMSDPAQAMPNFAQAYGIKCSYCHIQIPALNAYGRYVQRTGFAALNPHVLERESPVWVDYPVSYSRAVAKRGFVGYRESRSPRRRRVRNPQQRMDVSRTAVDLAAEPSRRPRHGVGCLQQLFQWFGPHLRGEARSAGAIGV